MGQFLDAAETVLRAAQVPLSSDELTRRALAQGLLFSAGQTPQQTMKSKLSTDILVKSEASRFMRTAKNEFALREWLGQAHGEYRADRYRKTLLDEDVVVFPASVVTHHLPGTGLQEGHDDTARSIARSAGVRKRQAAESDPSVVQMVSVFIVHHGTAFLTYKRTRRLPEHRLHGTYSMFFGGHVTASEFGQLFDEFDPRISKAFFERELLEELRIPLATSAVSYVGLLYDTSAPVVDSISALYSM